MLLLIAFTALDSVFITLGVVLDPFFGALGFSTGQISIAGGCTVIAGVSVSLVSGVLLDKYRKYLRTLRIICWGATVVFALAYSIFIFKSFWFLCIIATIIGGVLVPILPVGSAFAGELTFPME